MNEHALVSKRRDHRYQIPADAPLLIPRLIRENLSITRKRIRHPIFRSHCRALGKIDWGQLAPPIREAAARLFAVLEARSSILFNIPPEHLRAESFLRMAAYHDYWIQPPEEWFASRNKDATRQVFSLIKHLFIAYPIPDFFRKAWMQPGPLRSPARDWFCQIASGKNLRKLDKLPTPLTRQAAHCAMSAPPNLTIEQALRYGQIIAFGGSPELAHEIIRSRAGTDFQRDHLWLTLIEKIAREPRFAPWEAAITIDYIYYRLLANEGRSPKQLLASQHIFELAKRARTFWKEAAERAAVALEEKALAEFGYQHIRNRLLEDIKVSWPPIGKIHPATVQDNHGGAWHFNEICNGLELQREGARMHNCVATYMSLCQKKLSSIWSVTDSSGNAVATIDIHPKRLQIDEARGRFNRQPPPHALHAIRHWAHHFKVAHYWLNGEYPNIKTANYRYTIQQKTFTTAHTSDA